MPGIIILLIASGVLRLAHNYYYSHTFLPACEKFNIFYRNVYATLDNADEYELDFEIPKKLLKTQDKENKNSSIVLDYYDAAGWVKRLESWSLILALNAITFSFILAMISI